MAFATSTKGISMQRQSNKVARKPMPTVDAISMNNMASAPTVVGSGLPRAQRARLGLLKCGARKTRSKQLSLVPKRVHKGNGDWVAEMVSDMGINDIAPVLYSDSQGVNYPTLFPEFKDVSPSTAGSEKSLRDTVFWEDQRQRRDQRVSSRRMPAPQYVVKSTQHIQQPCPRALCH